MIFYLLFNSIYFTMHLYIYARMRVAFGSGAWQYFALAWFSFIIFFWFSGRTLLKDCSFFEPLAMGANIWLGFVLFLLMILILCDVLRVGLFIVDIFTRGTLHDLLPTKVVVPFSIVVALGLSVYSMYNARNIEVVHIQIATPKLEATAKPIRIALLTDVHLAANITTEDFAEMLESIKQEKPDLLLLTGDIVDTDLTERPKDAQLLKAATPTMGIYAVLGNHEYYAGIENSMKFYRDSGSTLLRGDRAVLENLVILGADDPVWGKEGGATTIAPLLHQTADELKNEKFVIVLRHRPTIEAGTLDTFDLQLSGHTHHGQIWPGTILASIVNDNAVYGLDKQGVGYGETYTYNSAGAGFWGPPMRFLSRAEITIIEIVSSHAATKK